jgi:hypothetical protein
MNVRRIPVTRRPPRRAAFTLVELALSLFVFGMILVLFGAIFPVATRAGHVGGNYAEASFLAQHKIDQLRDLGGAKLDGASLASRGLIDTDNNGKPLTVPNPAGLPAGMVSYPFTLTDNLVNNTKNGVSYSGFFPAGSTGILSVGDYHDLTAAAPVGTNVVVPATVIKCVTVTISWTEPNQANGTLTTHTAIAPL